MYKLTRQEAAENLNISTRSIDRYIKSWKIRAKKDWKIVYVHQDDINNLTNSTFQNQEVIIPSISQKNEKIKDFVFDEEDEEVIIKKNTQSKWLAVLEPVYQDLRAEINKKDLVIQDLSIRLWRAEEIAKNSISLSEFKKSQFLLEESKWSLSNEIIDLKDEKIKIEKELKYEKNTNNILLIFIILLLLIAWIIWFIKV